MFNMATAVPGIGDAAMLAKMGGGILPGLMTAYHGTPHRFPPTESNPLGEFDLSKIGTGEGAQTYGHGIYLAENPKTAKAYQTALAKRDFGEFDDAAEEAYWWTEGVGKNRKAGTDELTNALNSPLSDFWGKHDVDRKRRALEYLKSDKPIPTPKVESNLYDVDLPDEQIAKMLDWDAPLSEQPESVQGAIRPILEHLGKNEPTSDAVNKILDDDPLGLLGDYESADFFGTMTGRDIYQKMAYDVPNAGNPVGPKEVSSYLNELGIPGLKYYDAGSRTAGEGTRNFVMFDPSVSTIIGRR
jgi:hypothetical protein